MCIAILNRNSNPVSKEYFENSLYNNSDGFGMAWAENGQVKTFKSLSNNPKKLYSQYLKRFEKTTLPMLLHFRISTSGLIDIANCHPFHTSDRLAFIHNGIINGLGNALENDTRHFNRIYLKHISENDILSNKAIQDLISSRIGHSKLVFLNADGETAIINSKLGIEETDGNWYSNSTYSYGKCEYWYPKAKSWNDWEEAEVYTKCGGCDNMALSTFDTFYKMYVCKECKDWINESK